MCGHHVESPASSDAWATDNKWDVNIGVESAFLTRMHPMLTDVVAIVRGVEDIGVVQKAFAIEHLDEVFDHFVY